MALIAFQVTAQAIVISRCKQILLVSWLHETTSIQLGGSGEMRKNLKARYAPVVLIPAILPAVLMPVMVSHHVPDNVIGAAMGFSIGLAIVGIAWMKKSTGGCKTLANPGDLGDEGQSICPTRRRFT